MVPALTHQVYHPHPPLPPHPQKSPPIYSHPHISQEPSTLFQFPFPFLSLSVIKAWLLTPTILDFIIQVI